MRGALDMQKYLSIHLCFFLCVGWQFYCFCIPAFFTWLSKRWHECRRIFTGRKHLRCLRESEEVTRWYQVKWLLSFHCVHWNEMLFPQNHGCHRCRSAKYRPGVSNLTWKGPVCVQVFISIKQEPHLIPLRWLLLGWNITCTHAGLFWIRLDASGLNGVVDIMHIDTHLLPNLDRCQSLFHSYVFKRTKHPSVCIFRHGVKTVIHWICKKIKVCSLFWTHLGLPHFHLFALP